MVATRPFPIDQAYPNAIDLRRELGGLLPREGVFPTPTIIASGVAYKGTGWNVGARECVVATRRGTDAFSLVYGTALLANDSLTPTAWTLSGPPASGSRIDLLWMRATDPLEGEATTTLEGETDPRAVPLFGITEGVAGVTPARPALPAGAVEIAEVTTPAGAASISSSTIRHTFRYAAPAGGPLIVRNASELPAVVMPGEVVTTLDGADYLGTATGWEEVSAGRVLVDASSAYEGGISDTVQNVWTSGTFTLRRRARLLVTIGLGVRGSGPSQSGALHRFMLGTEPIATLQNMPSSRTRVRLSSGTLGTGWAMLSASRVIDLAAGDYNFAAATLGSGGPGEVTLVAADGMPARTLQIARLG